MTMGITTHILDVSVGRPAAGVPVRLELAEGDGWRIAGSGITDADGRSASLLADGATAAPGTWRLTFDTAAYFQASGTERSFYPQVAVTFTIDDAAEHHHVPLLLSPFGYSTYRGS